MKNKGAIPKCRLAPWEVICHPRVVCGLSFKCRPLHAACCSCLRASPDIVKLKRIFLCQLRPRLFVHWFHALLLPFPLEMLWGKDWDGFFGCFPYLSHLQLSLAINLIQLHEVSSQACRPVLRLASLRPAPRAARSGCVGIWCVCALGCPSKLCALRAGLRRWSER